MIFRYSIHSGLTNRRWEVFPLSKKQIMQWCWIWHLLISHATIILVNKQKKMMIGSSLSLTIVNLFIDLRKSNPLTTVTRARALLLQSQDRNTKNFWYLFLDTTDFGFSKSGWVRNIKVWNFALRLSGFEATSKETKCFQLKWSISDQMEYIVLCPLLLLHFVH